MQFRALRLSRRDAKGETGLIEGLLVHFRCTRYSRSDSFVIDISLVIEASRPLGCSERIGAAALSCSTRVCDDLAKSLLRLKRRRGLPHPGRVHRPRPRAARRCLTRWLAMRSPTTPRHARGAWRCRCRRGAAAAASSADRPRKRKLQRQRRRRLGRALDFPPAAAAIRRTWPRAAAGRWRAALQPAAQQRRRRHRGDAATHPLASWSTASYIHLECKA